MEILIYIIAGAAAYLIGSINGIDIREHGSGNAGMTNVTRVLGAKAGMTVFVIDIFKAVLAYTVASLLFDGGGTFFASGYVLPGLYAGLGTILGHNFPFFLKFKGGKGMACTVGLLLMLDWRIAVIVYLAAVLAVAVFRYISLASLLMTLLTPNLIAVFSYGIEAFAITAGLCALAWFMHRENIKRLLAGTESKFMKKS
jgi:glycerol-3-phosphate acyltransferase PlsY